MDWNWPRLAWLCLYFSCLARMRFILQVGRSSECQAGRKSHRVPSPGNTYLLSFQLGQGLLLNLAVEVDALQVGCIVEGKAPAGKSKTLALISDACAFSTSGCPWAQPQCLESLPAPLPHTEACAGRYLPPAAERRHICHLFLWGRKPSQKRTSGGDSGVGR